MATTYSPIAKSISDISGPSGWYGVKVNGKNVPVYVNQDYDGGGWVLVMANRASTGGMNNLTYHNAINNVNYRTEPSSNNVFNTAGYGPRSGSSLADFNVFIGLKYWSALAGRVTTNRITAVQFAAGTNGTALNGTHSERWRWSVSGFSGTYAFQSATDLGGEGGTTVTPGMYATHVVGGSGLTTFDNDQDQHANNCSTFYNNNPFWYTACWSGNMFAGGGYLDSPYWTSSTAGNNRQYMALYIK